MSVGVVHTALDDGHFGRNTAEKQWGRRGVGTVVGHLQNRQGTGIRTVRHVLLLVRLGVASEQDAGCAIGQQDGHGVVVDLGEQTAFCVRRRSYTVRDGSNAPSPLPSFSSAPARMAPLTSRDLSGYASTSRRSIL